MKATEFENEMPLELRLDLLVDGELGEYQRAELLRLLDREPQRWRELGVRFLQQQTEKQSVRKLMVGGNLVPVEVIPPKRNVIGYVGMRRFAMTAAGLFIAVSSALVTLYVTRQPAAHAGEFTTSLPPQATASDALDVTVRVIRAEEDTPIIPAALDKSTRASCVVQPDGKGGAIVIPVNTFQKVVY